MIPIPLRVEIRNYPEEFVRHVWVKAGCHIEDIIVDAPLPEMKTLQDIRNEFDFLHRHFKSLTHLHGNS